SCSSQTEPGDRRCGGFRSTGSPRADRAGRAVRRATPFASPSSPLRAANLLENGARVRPAVIATRWRYAGARLPRKEVAFDAATPPTARAGGPGRVRRLHEAGARNARDRGAARAERNRADLVRARREARARRALRGLPRLLRRPVPAPARLVCRRGTL